MAVFVSWAAIRTLEWRGIPRVPLGYFWITLLLAVCVVTFATAQGARAAVLALPSEFSFGKILPTSAALGQNRQTRSHSAAFR
jgi:hypothetical protein